jgi:hypothetical protein
MGSGEREAKSNPQMSADKEHKTQREKSCARAEKTTKY